MAYQVHNFINGEVIDATPINEMDAQIQANEQSLSGKVNTNAIGAANGVAGLDNGAKVPTTQLPSDLLYTGNVASELETQQIISNYNA